MSRATGKSHPPGWAVAFLHWFCPDQLVEGIYGDLLEVYSEDVSRGNTRRANRMFVMNALQMFHPAILLRNKFSFNLISMGLFKSHLLVAFRTMKKHKFYSSINMIGLSLAVGFIFLVFLFVQNELSFDQFHAHKDSIYRVYQRTINIETDDVMSENAVTAIPLARDLKAELPAIKSVTRFGSAPATVSVAGSAYTETLSFVDTAFFEMFSFPMLKGNIASALDMPNSVVLTKETAIKYFGAGSPMNQVIEVTIGDSILQLMVTGIIDPMTGASSIQFDLLLPFEQFGLSIPPRMMDSYHIGLIETYIHMPSGGSRERKAQLLTQAIQVHSPPNRTRTELGIQGLNKLHLESNITGNAIYTNPRKVYILIGLALLVLLVAGINFITLSIGHAMNRMSEIGVRKTLGALRGQLRRQFVSEAFLITVTSCLVGVFLARLALPYFNELVSASVDFSLNILGIGLILLLTILIGLFSGVSQSVMLVRQNVSLALKGKIYTSKKSDRFSQGLVVFQFALSIVLIIGTLGMQSQMRFIQNAELGFDKERLLEITMNSSSDKEAANLLLQRFRSKALENKRIIAVCGTMNTVREPWTSMMFEQADGTKETIFYNQVDPGYLNTMGIELVSGKNFSADVKGSADAVLVNETLVAHFAWDDAIGQEIPGKKFNTSPRVIGVIKDYHFGSLHNNIEPLILGVDETAIKSGISGLSTYQWPPNLYQMIVRFGPGEIQPVIDHLNDTWANVVPTGEFVYNFVDESIDAAYAEDRRWSKVTLLSSLFAIIIAWLGLLGLVRLTVERKTKEIGIRKVLGSTTEGVIALLSRKFLVLVLIGNVLAWPIAWWLLREWLQSFEYRVVLQPSLFIVAGLSVLIVVLSSVSLQSLKAAMANPAEAMRTD